jgi:hypothetical protein
MANMTMSKDVVVVCNVDFLADSRYFFSEGLV